MAKIGYTKKSAERHEAIFGKAKEITKEAEKTTEEMEKQEEATERIKLNTAETLKFSKQVSQQEAKRVEAADDLDKSYASLLGNLVKGNVAEIASFNLSKKTLGITGQLRDQSQKVLKHAQDEANLHGLSAKA